MTLLDEVQEIINKYLEGKKFLRKNDFAIADKKLQVALQNIDKQHPLYISLTAQELFLRAASVNDLFSDTLISKADYQKTVQLLDSAQKLLPKAAYIYQIKGEIFYAMDEDKKALEVWQQAHELSPKWVYPVYSMATVYNYMGNYVKAIEYLELAISLDSTMHTLECTKCAFSGLADIYAAHGKPNKALENINIAISLDSDFVALYTDAVDILCKQKKYAEAKQYAETVMPFDSSAGWYCLGAIEMSQKKPETAKEYFLMSVERDSSYGFIYYLLAEIAQKEKDYDTEHEYYSKFINASPNYYDAYEKLMNYLEESGRQEEIEPMLKDGLKRSQTEDVRMNLHILMALEYYRQWDEADGEDEMQVELEKKIFTQLESALQMGYRYKNYLSKTFTDFIKKPAFKNLMAKY